MQNQNSDELSTIVFQEMFGLIQKIKFGAVSCNIVIHNGIISKVELSETRKTRIGGVE